MPVDLPHDRQTPRSWAFALGGLLMVSYCAFGGYRNFPYKIESDGKYYYQYLVSAVYDGDLDFSNQYRVPKYSWMKTEIDHYHLRDVVSPETGRPANYFSPGPAILWAPFFACAWLLGAALNTFGLAIDMNPFGRWFQFGVMTAGPVYAVLSLLLLERLLSRSRLVSEASSWLSLGLVLFGSPLYYYAVFEPSMSHVYDLFAYVVYLLAILRWVEKDGFRELAVLSLSGALLILVRPQNTLTVALFSLVVLLLPGRLPPANISGSHPNLGRLLAAALPVLGGVLPTLALNRYLYGRALIVPQGASFLQVAHPNLLELFFSERNGLFSYHPLLLVGLAGFGWLLASRPFGPPRWFLRALLGSFVMQAWLDSSVTDWWAGHSFGQRRLLSSLPLFTLGLAFLLEKVRGRAGDRFTPPVLAMAAATAVLGFYLVLIHVFVWSYDEPHDVARWMFVKVPSKVIEKLLSGRIR